MKGTKWGQRRARSYTFPSSDFEITSSLGTQLNRVFVSGNQSLHESFNHNTAGCKKFDHIKRELLAPADRFLACPRRPLVEGCGALWKGEDAFHWRERTRYEAARRR